MNCKLTFLLLNALAAGCATTPKSTIPHVANALPAEALITQRAVLTARGRQFTMNGYLASSATGDQRLIVTENLGNILADVLVKSDGATRVMRSSPMFRPAWIERYLAADVRCIFGGAAEVNCPGRRLSPTHFVIERRWYTLDLQIVETKPGPQPPELFDETRKAAP
ncbi:MAG TPA: hypothetical protein VGK40_06640 [Verrucomicrobiae bacterium]|jgi:hypothetical protein